jgi:hypothetical protein
VIVPKPLCERDSFLFFSAFQVCLPPTVVHIGWRDVSDPFVIPPVIVRVDNATPIILNCEKSVTLGTLGTLALWRSTKL